MTATATTTVVAGAAPARLAYLDKIRGAAILLMIVDHLCIVLSGPEVLRMTVGRLAMPLFFLVSGALVTRFGFRHVLIFGLGVVLPWYVTFIDNPNVLTLYAVGALVMVVFRALDVHPLVIVAVILAAAANGFLPRIAPGYEFTAVLGIMCVGGHVGRHALGWFDWLPRWLAPLGRYPLTIYVGHLLALQLYLELTK